MLSSYQELMLRFAQQHTDTQKVVRAQETSMTTETTYTLAQLQEKINEYLKTLENTKYSKDEFYGTPRELSTHGLDEFLGWLKPVPDCIGWIGDTPSGLKVFSKEPSDLDIKRYYMRKVIYKPEETK